jgi:hypothetical protein
MELDQAIRATVEGAKTEPTMQCGDWSVEELTRLCDPTTRGVSVFGAANNRAAAKRYAAIGDFTATPEDVQTELAILASEGHVMPRCCGGSCRLPRVEVAS